MQNIEECKQAVWVYYAEHARSMPWRYPEPDGTFDAYKIMVSEIMLQQTQVARVVPKFNEFVRVFPTITTLAEAELGDVLVLWSGLGYNRRARFLWQAAQYVVMHYGGIMPASVDELVKLPGIGKNTAAAIAAYAYNQPVVFIETNIRTVFIHHCFNNADSVTDPEIITRALAALPDIADPESSDYADALYRHWYWALMDYGSHLKATVGNPNKISKHYTKQSKFEGSRRQIRGKVLQLLTSGAYGKEDLMHQITDERLSDVLCDLESEGLIKRIGDMYSL